MNGRGPLRVPLSGESAGAASGLCSLSQPQIPRRVRSRRRRLARLGEARGAGGGPPGGDAGCPKGTERRSPDTGKSSDGRPGGPTSHEIHSSQASPTRIFFQSGPTDFLTTCTRFGSVTHNSQRDLLKTEVSSWLLLGPRERPVNILLHLTDEKAVTESWMRFESF